MQYGLALSRVVDQADAQLAIASTDIDALKDLGVQSLRVEASLGDKSAWDYATASLYCSLAEHLKEAGIDLILTITSAIVKGARQIDWNAPQGSLEWRAFLDAFREGCFAVTNSVPQAHAFEIWNEPNAWTQASPGYRAGGTYIRPENYAALLMAVAGETASFHDIRMGGILAQNIHGKADDESWGINYVRAVLGAPQGSALLTYQHPLLKGWGVHPYLDQEGALDPQHLKDCLGAYKKLLPNLPLHITEVGWPSPTPAEEVRQSANLTTLFSAVAPYVQSCHWFLLKDRPNLPFGLKRADGTNKPAYFGYRSLTRPMPAPTVTILPSPSGSGTISWPPAAPPMVQQNAPTVVRPFTLKQETKI